MQSLTRVRDIRDQLVGLCERVEIFVDGNPNSSDIIPIQKAICAGSVLLVSLLLLLRRDTDPFFSPSQLLPERRSTEPQRRRLPHHQVSVLHTFRPRERAR